MTAIEPPLEQLRRHLRRVPFRPFTLTVDGQAIQIDHPDMIALHPGSAPNLVIAPSATDIVVVGTDKVQHVKLLPRVLNAPAGWQGIEGRASSVDEFCDQLAGLGRPGWMYRGESQWFPTRRASIGRYLSPNAPEPLKAECSEIQWFQHRAHGLLSEAERELVRDDIIAWLTLMQHHGAPTRLLEWSYSPWVAAYHACVTDPDHSGYVWAFKPGAMASHRPESWKDFERSLTSAKTIDDYQRVLTKTAGEIVVPFYMIQATPRMVAQQGTYTFGHPPLVDHAEVIGRYIASDAAKILLIPNELKRPVMERLRSMNLTGASLFPGLDGVGRTTAETMRIPIETPWGV